MTVTVIQDVLIAGLAVIIVLGVAFAIFCLVALARGDRVRYLPKWAWALVIIFGSGLGALAFLAYGLG
jgi:hypothetical protein